MLQFTNEHIIFNIFENIKFPFRYVKCSCYVKSPNINTI